MTTTTGDSNETSVQVALRVRPQNAKEQIDMCQICTFCTPDQPQIVLGKDKAFTYDFVFDTDSQQDQIYTQTIEGLVAGCFEGYNATVLAYGQTGSGKTYTMGTGFDMAMLPEQLGVIPRAVHQLFSTIEQLREDAIARGDPPPQFEITAQFLELYNEDLVDLFDCNRDALKKLRIHEDPNGSIYIAGVTTQRVESEEETLSCLKQGALSRTVGSTNMNAQSSRSHAIFTLHIAQQKPIKTPVNDNSSGGGTEGGDEGNVRYEISDWESLTAKFHFVDLAGSERLKRTGATGERAKEGISINCGLLALGNVISALGDKAKKGSHVPYRDSKLTRLLQDSLGGNSRTLMVACVSPTDRDFMETLNTLKYANRARNIKNKVSVNQDKTSQQLAQFRARIQALESELQEFHSGRKVVSDDGSVVMNDLASEVTMLRAENDKLRLRVKSLQQVIDSQSERMASMAADRELAALGHHDESTGQVVGQSSSEVSHLPTVIKGYMRQIEELKSRLVLSESLGRQNPSSPYRRPPSLVLQGRQPSLLQQTRSGSVSVMPFNQETSELLETARSDIVRLRQRQDRKMSESDGSRRGGAGGRPRSRDITSITSLDVVSEVEGGGEGGGGGGGGLGEDPIFGSDDESNSTNEDSSDEELTVQGSDSSDDSEDEFDDAASLASNVADLSSEINLKEQLVDQLEKAQRNLHVMKQQYEDKMTLLQSQIHNIEAERDKVLKEISSRRTVSGVSSKDVKARYEKQLIELRTELKSLKMAKKEHTKAMKKNAQNENELRRLKADLLEMKKARVKLLNQMRMEASRKKQEEARQMRQISQLKKESRKKENRIQSLEADAQRKAIVMKRRADELALLRRQTRMRHSASNSSLSSTSSLPSQPHPSQPHPSQPHPSTTSHSSTHPLVGGEAGGREVESETSSVVFRDRPSVKSLANRFERNNRRKSSIFTSTSARKKWRNFEKKITDAIMNRLTMSTLSRDMDRWIEKRDQLSRRADELRHHKQLLMREPSPDPEEVQSVDEDLDSLLANVEYIQSNIVELQNDLIAIDDSKSDSDTVEAHAIITQCGPRDAKYLLEHLLTMTLGLGVKAEQQASLARSLQARLKTSEDNAELLKSFSSPQVTHPLMIASRTVTKTRAGSDGRSHVPVHLDFGSESSAQDTDDPGSIPDRPNCKPQSIPNNTLAASTKLRRRTYLPSEIRPASATNLTMEDVEMTDGGGEGRPRSNGSQGAADGRRKPLKKTAKSMSSSVQDLASADATASSTSSSSVAGTPSSPNASVARQLGGGAGGGGGGGGGGGKGDVWSRLTRSGSTNLLNDNRGQLQAEKSRLTARHLTCTHTASGHSAGVLSVFATQNLLFSGSQDRTVKLWDLNSGQEVLTLDKHFSYVRCVRYCTRNRLIFTASQSLIKIWDHRNFRGKCIKTFGPPHSGGHTGGDTVVQDLLLSSSDTLFSAAGNVVNIWDIRKFVNRGRLVGHNGAVCALALNQDMVITGSRDRLIKMYEMEAVHDPSVSSSPQSNTAPSHYPSVTLYPPHYDAVSSFAIHNTHLFSSCGCTFKQWNTDEKILKQAVDGAHPQGTSITSLGVLSSPLSPLLVSGCKGGLLKLWNPDTCANIGEVSAHKNAINSIATNDTCIFTASSDKTIRIWRSSPQDL